MAWFCRLRLLPLLVLGLLACGCPAAGTGNNKAAQRPLSQAEAQKAQADFEKGAEALKKEDYDLAVACFKAVLNLVPDDPATHINLGLAYYGLRDYDKALAECDAAVAAKPDLADAYA